jgi:clan AA aspartic protease
MMTGIVTSRREAILRLKLVAEDGREHAFDAMIDTGYNGTLTLPPNVIASLGLRWHRAGRAILADGSESQFNVYRGTILWDGQPITISIDEMDADPLVGMSLMYGYELTLPVLDGATFTLMGLAVE